MRPLVLASLIALTSCAAGVPIGPHIDAGPDAQSVWPDSGTDAGPSSIDAGMVDAGADASSVVTDAGSDAGAADAGALDAGVMRDAGSMIDGGFVGDAGALDGGACGTVGAGDTLVFDGIDDAAAYPASQVMTPGATLQSWDRFALTWDSEFLYVTMVSQAFEDQYKPVHVYVEAATTLGPATPSTGKVYSSLTPELPFSPTHLIALRRRSDSGMGGPYNGVYTPASSWNDRALPLDSGSDYWVASDNHTISVRVPWVALGCPSQLRLSAHVVNAVSANEWKDLAPATATPWTTSGGAFYEIDLSGDPAISGWTLR